MSDFTKDELKKILWHITTKTSIEPGNELVPKIQDMIENYCEPCPSAHEFYDRLVCEQCGLVEGF